MTFEHGYEPRESVCLCFAGRGRAPSVEIAAKPGISSIILP
jgi:hypothetical protein